MGSGGESVFPGQFQGSESWLSPTFEGRQSFTQNNVFPYLRQAIKCEKILRDVQESQSGTMSRIMIQCSIKDFL